MKTILLKLKNMAIRALNILKEWFSVGKYPTGSQFSDFLDSFWHKKEKIPMSSIDGLDEKINDIMELVSNNSGGENPGGPETIPVTGIVLSDTTLTLKVGESKQLTYTVAPSNATNKKVTFSSSNSSVCTVSSSGALTPLKSGSVEISVTTEDGQKVAKCTVTVSAETVYSFSTPQIKYTTALGETGIIGYGGAIPNNTVKVEFLALSTSELNGVVNANAPFTVLSRPSWIAANGTTEQNKTSSPRSKTVTYVQDGSNKALSFYFVQEGIISQEMSIKYRIEKTSKAYSKEGYTGKEGVISLRVQDKYFGADGTKNTCLKVIMNYAYVNEYLNGVFQRRAADIDYALNTSVIFPDDSLYDKTVSMNDGIYQKVCFVVRDGYEYRLEPKEGTLKNNFIQVYYRTDEPKLMAQDEIITIQDPLKDGATCKIIPESTILMPTGNVSYKFEYIGFTALSMDSVEGYMSWQPVPPQKGDDISLGFTSLQGSSAIGYSLVSTLPDWITPIGTDSFRIAANRTGAKREFALVYEQNVSKLREIVTITQHNVIYVTGLNAPDITVEVGDTIPWPVSTLPIDATDKRVVIHSFSSSPDGVMTTYALPVPIMETKNPGIVKVKYRAVSTNGVEVISPEQTITVNAKPLNLFALSNIFADGIRLDASNPIISKAACSSLYFTFKNIINGKDAKEEQIGTLPSWVTKNADNTYSIAENTTGMARRWWSTWRNDGGVIITIGVIQNA